MTSPDDRPYLDCATLTPMTGTGLVKFERFNAMNKLPWDDMNDQFVIQVSRSSRVSRLPPRLAGARCVHGVRDGHPAGRLALCKDCQQPHGERGGASTAANHRYREL